MMEQAINNPPIARFEFWKPVRVNAPFGESLLSRCSLRLGEWADRLFSYRFETMQINAEYVNPTTHRFEKDAITKDSWIFTSFKIAILLTTWIVLPIFSPYFLALPVTMLTIKAVYKYYLNSRIHMDKTFDNPNTEVTRKLIGNTHIVLLTGSITEETTEVIVNAANKGLWAGSGVCGAIRKAAGKEVFKECEEILKKLEKDEIETGEAVITTSGKLSPKVQAIVHAAGPDCREEEEDANRAELLTRVYVNSLELIGIPKGKEKWMSPSLANVKDPMRTIAFPPISTGIFGYKVEEATEVALKAVKKYIEEHAEKIKVVHFVCLPGDKDPKTLAAYQEAFEHL